MGVLFDYFRAPDAGAAIRALERDGGPKGRGGPGQPVFDAVDAKGIDHAVMLTQLVDIIRGEPTDFSTVGTLDFVSVWPSSTPPTGDEWTALPEGSPWREGPWIDELGQRTLDGLADADDARLSEIAARWARKPASTATSANSWPNSSHWPAAPATPATGCTAGPASNAVTALARCTVERGQVRVRPLRRVEPLLEVRRIVESVGEPVRDRLVRRPRADDPQHVLRRRRQHRVRPLRDRAACAQ